MDSYSSAFWATYGSLVLLLGIAGIILSVFIAKAAERKGRSFGGFLLLGLFVSPIISGIVVALIPEPSSIEVAKSAGQTRPCPRCGEEIMAIASICKHCQSEIEPLTLEVEKAPKLSDVEISNKEIVETWLDWHKTAQWEKAGKPNLQPWIDANRPDFYKWLKSL
jgi:hypothetical protein